MFVCFSTEGVLIRIVGCFGEETTGERERENSNSKNLMLKDSSVRTTQRDRQTDRQRQTETDRQTDRQTGGGGGGGGGRKKERKNKTKLILFRLFSVFTQGRP